MNWVRVAALAGFLGVALGAFGAHALEARLEAAGRVDTWKTAVFYHLVHALLLLALARWDGMAVARWATLAGILLFSGSLYALCLTGVRGLGAITPLGGLAFLAGWLWLAIKAREAA